MIMSWTRKKFGQDEEDGNDDSYDVSDGGCSRGRIMDRETATVMELIVVVRLN